MPTTEKRPAAPTRAEARGALPKRRDGARTGDPIVAAADPHRWDGVERGYGPADVERLRGSVQIEYTLARRGAERLWNLLRSEEFVPALGALTGNQAVQMVRAGLEAIYVSGWQVAADANTGGQTYPDQSLYPVDSVPALVRRINRALQRADQIERSESKVTRDWFAPIVADAEAGFGGPLNAFELMKALIEAGAAAAHFEDQLSSEKKCGHLGGKVLLPMSQFVRTLTAARLAADVVGVPTILVARTDAHSAQLITSDVDPRDREFVLAGERTPEGFHRLRGGIECAIARGVAYAPYADMIWCETSTPDLGEARRFAEGIHEKFPGKLLAYNCSPSFNWKRNLDDATIARFQRELAAMGYKFQFVTLAGFHALNHATFELARGYREHGMGAYTQLQQAEFAAERDGYTATRHQREAGTGYFDAVTEIVSAGTASTLALRESTESAQFARGDGLGRFEAALHDDHERVNEIAGRLEAAPDLPAMAAALDELRRALREHFEHEEKAEGFFGLLGARAHAAAAQLQRVMSEHAGLLEMVGRLADRARSSRTPRAEIAGEARRITAMLQDHERQEVALMAAAMA